MIDLQEEFKEKQFFLLTGNSLERLKELPDNSIDSIVCDPPYGLGKEPNAIDMLKDWVDTGHHEVKSKGGFMGKSWDSFVPQPQLWHECLRVLKPGGHLLSFAGTRTYDLVVLGLRLAGFEIRDQLAWVYGSGMPKALDVSKAIDKLHGAECQYGEKKPNNHSRGNHVLHEGWKRPWQNDPVAVDKSGREYLPTTEDAKQWDGWKSSLKPAMEPIVMARKPLDGTIAHNVLKWHCGALNIDACRVPIESGDTKQATAGARTVEDGKGWGINQSGSSYVKGTGAVFSSVGRFPSNFIHDGSDEVIDIFPESNGAGKSLPQVKITGYGDKNTGTGKADYLGGDRIPFDAGTGSAARFFYCAKTSSTDRHSGLENPGNQFEHGATMRNIENTETTGNNHPTVKPLALMSYLVRMVTPVGGIVLDPFNGSGSTGKAAMVEGMKYIGIDLSEDYIEISKPRIQFGLDNKQRLYNEIRDIKKSKKEYAPVLVQEQSGLEDLFETV